MSDPAGRWARIMRCSVGSSPAHWRAPSSRQCAGVFQVSAELDGEDYTGRTLIRRPSGTWAVEIVPVEVTEL